MKRKPRVVKKQAAGTPVSSWKHQASEWLRSLLFAVVTATAIHMLVIQPFLVPTPSMAGTVLPGDRILVTKFTYGALTPRTLAIPFTDVYLPGLEFPGFRLPGLSSIRHGDVVMFHLPVDHKPVDRKERYLKRVIGLPGDTLQIVDKQVLIDGRPIPTYPESRQLWLVRTGDPRSHLPTESLDRLDILTYQRSSDGTTYLVEGSRAALDEVRRWPYVTSVLSYITDESASEPVFPRGSSFTQDKYGPVVVPSRGMTVDLTGSDRSTYLPAIEAYEGRVVSRSADGSLTIDGKPATTYSFQQDYYFMMGDNRNNSLDSRYWGFVPEDHIAGKAIATFWSWDTSKGRLRWDRMFKPIR